MVFEVQVVEKGWQHFRDQGSLGIGNIVICVVAGMIYVCMVVHAVIVNGVDMHAKWEDGAGNGIVLY